MKNHDITDIYFYGGEVAYNKKEYYSKSGVIYSIGVAQLSAKKNSVKKDNTGKAIIYRFTMDDMFVNVHIIKKYEEENKEYIKEFDAIVDKDKKLFLKNLKKIVITAALSAGLTTLAYEPVKEKVNEIKEYFNVENLDDELFIHTGHSTVDGETVNPYYGHGCVFVDDKTISVPDRIKLYCDEKNIEYLEDAALEKYELLMDDKVEEAEKIDLHELRKENKQKVKGNLQ